jgi:hypothetical protein
MAEVMPEILHIAGGIVNVGVGGLLITTSIVSVVGQFKTVGVITTENVSNFVTVEIGIVFIIVVGPFALPKLAFPSH